MIPKQLGELLQEKQEPFILDIYLLEKGCSRNRFNLNPTFNCCSFTHLTKPLSKRRKIFPNCSNAAKAVFGKIGFIKNREKVKKSWSNAKAVSSSFSKRDFENSPHSLQEKENEAKENLQERNKEDIGKQATRTRIKLQLQPEEPNSSNPHHSSTNKVMHQSKQLVFDCVKELFESNKWKLRRERNLLQLLKPEEIGKLLSEDLRIWSILSGNESNISQLLNVDFGVTIGEWRDFELEKRDFSAEIGDAIFDDVSKEIVADMIAFVRPH